MTNFSRESAFKAVCFALLLSFFSFSVCAQSSSLGEQNQTSQENQLVSEDVSASASSSSSSSENTNWNWSTEGYNQNQQTPSTFGLFVRMVFALALVLAIAYIAMRLLKRSSKLSNSDDPFLRHVSHLSLSASRSVDVVTILDHAYILGVSDNAVNLVGEITDKELVNSMNLYADKNDNTKRPRSFNDILSIFMPNPNRNGQNENVYGSSAWNASELLRRQRERLNEGEEE